MNAHPTLSARTFSGNRQKAAAEDKAKAEAEFEGRLKERNDGSYEAFSQLSDSERQAVLISESEAYRHADTEARSWGIGGSKSRAVNAGTILLTGILGGKTNLQTAANTLSPYAATAIGNTLGHGTNQNETAQLVGHFLLGATLAYINGGDPLSGGSAAVAAEKAAQYLSQQYNDGQTAIDPQTGEFNPNLLPEQIKEEIKSTTGVIASIVGATGDNGAALNAQIGGVLGQNAVENNRFLRPINANVGRTTQNLNQPRYRNLPLQSTPLNPQQIANVRRLNQLENEIRQLEPNFKGLPDHQIGSPGSSYVPYTNARVAQYQNYLNGLKRVEQQNFLFSATQSHRGEGITQAGRAVTKHPEYFGFSNTGQLRETYRRDYELNKLGEQHIQNILNNGIRTNGVSRRYPNGWVTYTLPNGMAASWHRSGEFIGFRGIK